ncbi:7225_t:CDS:2 [Paraglomus occultum]|uniref:7225_t:CDS:1 n=1 Tax=Paraglomus occultum TaxID=144539 RepID=A0A9N8ZXE2_9GLOM|nr:7225_t:CDS:2 [Paraglomus occultum]
MGISTTTENDKKPLTSTHLSDYGTFIPDNDNKGQKSKDCDNKKSTHNNADSCSSTDLEDQETSSLACRQRNGICGTSLILRNEVSVARDMLSLERTFLSYLRLSMSIMLTGASLTFQSPIPVISVPPETYALDSLSPESSMKPLSISLILIGMILLVWAVAQYFRFTAKIANRVLVVENTWTNFLVVFIIGGVIGWLCMQDAMHDDDVAELKSCWFCGLLK